MEATAIRGAFQFEVSRVVADLAMPPGAIALTRTLRYMYSSASARVSCTTPPFDAQYAAL